MPARENETNNLTRGWEVTKSSESDFKTFIRAIKETKKTSIKDPTTWRREDEKLGKNLDKINSPNKMNPTTEQTKSRKTKSLNMVLVLEGNLSIETITQLSPL